MSKILDENADLIRQLEESHIAAEEAAANQQEPPLPATQYFEDVLRSEPELADALEIELQSELKRLVDGVRTNRTRQQQDALKAEYEQRLAQGSAAGTLDRAALAVEFAKRGLGKPVKVSAYDNLVLALLEADGEKIIERARQRLAGKRQNVRQDELMKDFKAELASLPRGFSLKAYSELQGRYRKLGLRFPGDDIPQGDNPTQPGNQPQPKRQGLTKVERDQLIAEYQAERNKVKGNIRLIVELQRKYRQKGLNI